MVTNVGAVGEPGSQAGSDAAPGPLSGVVVADFSRLLAGPYATMLLGDLGADVVKVEHPDGDDARGWGPFLSDGTSVYFTAVNRNKRSVVLDLAAESDRATATALLRRSDVLVHNFRPASVRRLGLSEADLDAVNPDLVVCDISAFGAAAPDSALGNDFLLQALGGAMSVTGTTDGAPEKVGFPVVDVLTGLHAAVGVLAALLGGHGQHVEVDLLTSLLSGMVNQSAAWLNTGRVPPRMGSAHPGIAPYRVYQASDGPLAVAAASDRQFRNLARVVGRSDLADDPRFAGNGLRVEHRAELDTALSEALAAASTAHWTERLTAAGVPAGPVQGVDGAFALAARLGIEAVVEQELAGGLVRTVADPVRLSRTPVSYRRPAPGLGQHTAEVVASLASG